MGLRIGNMVWNTSEELKELLELVNKALDQTEAEERYFNHLHRTVNLTKSIRETVEEIGEEGLILVNAHTGETMRIKPGQILLATTPTMTEWEKEPVEEN